MSVTIRRIAEMAGVSTGTVDRALNNRGRIDPQVASRIKQIATELNYQPNALAKSLSIKRRKPRIAVILNVTGNQFISSVLQGVTEAAESLKASGFTVDIFPSKDFDPADQGRLIDQVVADGYHAIVMIPINHDLIRARVNELSQGGLPIVLLTSKLEDTHYFAYVGCNYRYSGYVACGLLNQITEGEVRAGVLVANLQMWSNRERLTSMQEYMKRKYPRIHLDDVLEISNDDIHSYEETKRFLAQHTDMQAVLYCSSAVEGGMMALVEHYARHPVKILAYDFTETVRKAMYDRVIPFILSQNPKEQGYRAIELIADHFIRPKKEWNRDYYVNTEILLRESIKDYECSDTL